MGVSLNSQLLQGPDLANKLLGVLIRFREEKVAVVGDVEAMFHQVIVPPSDRDCLRFFWWPDGNLDKEPKMYRMVSHLFGATSSPSCCNFALKCTAEEKGHQFEPIITETIKRNMYVDDCLTSTVSDEKAKALINDLSALCQEGGFRLTKWTSNSAAVLEAIPEENRATSKQRNLESDSPVERALGVHWFTEKDTLGFQINVKDQPPTRRGILSMVSSVYDPLGIASPFILTAKSILQNLCKQGIRWDDDITDADLRKWNTWISQLHELENVEVERCYKPSDLKNVTSVQLHSFSDASDTGLGMVFYLRFIDETGRIHCSFLLGKSRVAPLKTVTVPRMELTAASSAVKLCKMIKEELGFPINETFYWTDSTSVLRYIANKNARFHTFVANRVSVIREATEENQWRYVNTKENPADCASRGLSIGKFRQNPQWINGPDFLWKSESEWPEYQLDKTIENDDAEVKRVVNTASLDKTNSCEGMDRLLTRFSDYTKLKRITAWMLTAIGNLKSAVQRTKDITDRIRSSESNTQNREKMMETAILADRQSRLAEAPKRVKSLFLTSDALNRSEMALVRYVQRKDFQEEFESLQRCGKVNRSSKLRDLDPYIDNGLLRVGGRLERADMSFDAKHPIILPKESKMSQPLIEDAHQSVGHLGKNSILTVLRQRYWIIKANASIKRVVSRCVICRKYQAPCSRQKMANLPRERLVPDEPPFTKVGMDFFGPLETKRGRSCVKRYGVIFTCLSTRAVHLELAFSLDTDSCIDAIRRFIARRGRPEFIRSDNVTNLVGAEREMREEVQRLNSYKIRDSMAAKGIHWEFNPPSASHFGGVWERLIRSVRKVLHSVMREQPVRLDDENLQTLFCEVESILNGRPISELSNDANDVRALTPNHLLLLRPGEWFPPGTFKKTDNYVKRRWRQVQYLADIFWTRWIKEYLPLLQSRQKWTKTEKNLKVGDLVLVMDSSPRNAWNMGRVLEVIMDNKDTVRIVKVKTASSVLTRPIQKLCLILESDVCDM